MSSVTHQATSQADAAHKAIRELIMTKRLGSETPWTERHLGESLSMSRTPVREALKRLQSEGLLTSGSAKGGLTVAVIPESEVLNVYRLRGAMEALSAELAAERCARGELSPADLASLKKLALEVEKFTDEHDAGNASEANIKFHERISFLSGNSFLRVALDRLWGRIAVSAWSNMVDDPCWVDEVNQQHQELVELISAGKSAEAAALAAHHIRRASETYAQHHRG